MDRIGEFRKTSKADMLVGTIVVNGKIIDAYAFIKTKEQKRKPDDPDIVILVKEEQKSIFS